MGKASALQSWHGFITYLHLFDFIQKCIYLNGFESA